MDTATISSMLEAAMTRVDIPFFSPYPFSFKDNREGITTAGVTALKMLL